MKVVIIGVGLLGSSLGLNIISRKIASEVIGVGRNQSNLKEAVRLKAIHCFVKPSQVSSLFLTLTKDDLVILASPVQSILDYLKILPKAPLVIDVGSTKGTILKEAEKRKLRFVGCHPIAGTEKSGAEAGEIDLFRGKICLITPTKQTRREDLQKVQKFWEKMGSRVEIVEGERHDKIFAAVSHLPHVIAYSLISVLPSLIQWPKDLKFVFSSLRGMTRIAESPPEMWRDIFLTNRKFILKVLDRYLKELKKLRTLLARGQSRALFNYLEKSQGIRLRFPQ